MLRRADLPAAVRPGEQPYLLLEEFGEAQYIVEPAPWESRSEPLFVVDQKFEDEGPASRMVSNGIRIATARCHCPAALKTLKVTNRLSLVKAASG